MTYHDIAFYLMTAIIFVAFIATTIYVVRRK